MKKSYLLQSQAKFLRGHGNGCSNTDSECPTGDQTSDGAKKIPALCLPFQVDSTWPFPAADFYQKALNKHLENPPENGTVGETFTQALTYAEITAKLNKSS